MCWGTLQIAQGIGGTLMGAIGQNEAAERQNQAYIQNAANANASASEQYAQNYLRQIQEEAAATQARIKNRIETMRTRGTALASSQNSGASTFGVLHDIERQGAREGNVIDANLENTTAQLAANTTNIYNEAQQRIDSMPTASGADPVATALSGLGVVVGISNDATRLSKDIANPSPSSTKSAALPSTWQKPTNSYDLGYEKMPTKSLSTKYNMPYTGGK